MNQKEYEQLRKNDSVVEKKTLHGQSFYWRVYGYIHHREGCPPTAIDLESCSNGDIREFSIPELLNNFDMYKKHLDASPGKALDIQIGGNHYKDMKIQPGDYAFQNNLNVWQFNVVKYVSRYKTKDGIEDLKKAKHCIDLLIDAEYGDENA